ncbi:MAG: site-specific integrase [Protaetiibacter sp.]
MEPDPISAAWTRALYGFEAACIAAAAPPAASLALHMRLLRTFARTVDVAPWGVTEPDVEQWLQRRGYSRESRRTYRRALRLFYSWALRTGAIDRSPIVTRPPVPRRQVGAAWDAALNMWHAGMLERGVQESSIQNWLKSLRRFENEAGCGNPWNVTAPDIQRWLDALPPSRTMRAKHRAALRSLYRWAEARGLIEHDPTAELSERCTPQLASPEWEQMLAAYVRYLRTEGKPTTTVRMRLGQLRRFARQNPSLVPTTVTTDDMLDWLSHKRWKPSTMQGHRCALRDFYRWAKQTGRMRRNPAKKLPKVKVPDYAARPASELDYRIALAKADATERLMLRLAAELGLRCGEISRTHASDLYRVGDGWALVVHGKGRRDRVLPLTPDLLGAIRARGDGWLFPGRVDGHVSAEWVSKRGSSLLPPGVSMHMLRHRFATRAYEIDRDVLTVQQLLGHASPATTQRYVRVSSDRMRALVEAVAS